MELWKNLLTPKVLKWIFVSIAIIGAICNAQALVIGFILWIISNTYLLIINWQNKEYAQSMLFAVYDIICIWGIVNWLQKGI
jgi:nicotinamide riboside transporter PnuC